MDQPSGEMSVINAALADARSGQGAVVLIDGRAGLRQRCSRQLAGLLSEEVAGRAGRDPTLE
jgi:hypothetical protein